MGDFEHGVRSAGLMALELSGHELGGLPPAHPSLDRGAYAAQELVHP